MLLHSNYLIQCSKLSYEEGIGVNSHFVEDKTEIESYLGCIKRS